MISENIRHLRKARKLSQKELAELLGVSNKTVSKWETGLGLPDIQMIVPLSQALGVSTDAILKEHPAAAAPAGPPPERKQQLREGLTLLQEKHGITAEQLLISLQMKKAELDALLTHNYPGTKDGLREKQLRLGKLLVVLTELIPLYTENPPILVSSLFQRLQRDNDLSGETVESYAGLKAGTMEKYSAGLSTLTSRQLLTLVISLFLLDRALNPEDAFPGDS